MHRHPLAAASLAVLLLAGCSSGTGTAARSATPTTTPDAARTAAPSATPAAAPSGSVDYLYTDHTGVDYLRMTIHPGGAIEGQALAAALRTHLGKQRVMTGTDPFTGVLEGHRVTLNFDDHTDNGTVTGNTLRLSVIQTNGAIKVTTYTKATDAGYNMALAALRASTRSTG